MRLYVLAKTSSPSSSSRLQVLEATHIAVDAFCAAKATDAWEADRQHLLNEAISGEIPSQKNT
eukprot:5802104-Amphidinium_carterae.1